MKTGRERYIVEARNEDGALNFETEQPPSELLDVDENKLFDHFFAAHPEKQTASWEELNAWLKSKGWVARERTW